MATLDVVSRLASQVLLPLDEALRNPAALQELLDDLGWEVPLTFPGLGLDPKRLAAVADALEDVLELRDGTPDDETVIATYAKLLGAVAALAQDVHDLRTTLAKEVDAA